MEINTNPVPPIIEDDKIPEYPIHLTATPGSIVIAVGKCKEPQCTNDANISGKCDIHEYVSYIALHRYPGGIRAMNISHHIVSSGVFARCLKVVSASDMRALAQPDLVKSDTMVVCTPPMLG